MRQKIDTGSKLSKDKNQIEKESNERRGIKRVPLTEKATNVIVKHQAKEELKSRSETIQWLDREIKRLRKLVKRLSKPREME